MLKVYRELSVRHTRVPSVGVTFGGIRPPPLADLGSLAGIGLQTAWSAILWTGNYDWRGAVAFGAAER